MSKVHVTGVLAVLLCSTASILAAADSSAKHGPVRKLTVQVEPMDAAMLSAKAGAAEFDSEESVKKLGKAIAGQIAGQVDFAKEKLVHIGWGSSGPPFGELRQEVKEGKDGQEITFHVQEPKADIRGQAYRLGNDFFAVPKGAKVSFTGTSGNP
jgi:hypothetical protein